MNQFDKHNIIVFKQGDVVSIKNALSQYLEYLNSDQAFIKSFMGLFNVEFKIETTSGIRRLQTSDVCNTDVLEKALNMGPESAYTTQTINEGDEIYISEAIFFAIALEHEVLKTEIVDTTKAMVAAMRRYNDTDRVWIDDMRIFGIEAIYLLACKYPEYTYLLGHFFIPYWDLEHAVGYESYLFSLVKQHGWTRDLIKAFIWCDNGYFRYCMYGEGDNYRINSNENQPLGDFLKQNPAEYDWFKQAVTERFKQEAILLYSENEEADEKNPVVELYLSLFGNCSDYFENEDNDENQELLQEYFITDTLENEAFDLQDSVTAAIKGPLAKHSERNQLSLEQEAFHDRTIYKGDGIKNLKELIDALPNGANIWNYIESGNDAEILDQIKKTEIVPLAKEHAPNFYKTITYFTSPLDYEGDIPNNLADILNEVTYDLLNEDDEENDDVMELGNGFVSRITVHPQHSNSHRSQKEQNRQQYLRILDVFFRILDVQKLDSEIEEILTDDEDLLLTIDEFYERYSKAKKAPKKKKLSLTDSSFGSVHHEMDHDVRLYIEKVIKQNDRGAFDCSNWGNKTPETITMAAYLAYNDRMMMMFDEKTQKLLEHIGDGPWRHAFDQVCDHLNMDELAMDEKALLEEYITLVNGKPQAEENVILDILRTHLHREEIHRGDLTFNKFNAQQASYSLFFYDDGFQHILLCCYWMRYFNPPLTFHASRIFSLFLKLAPQRVLKQIGKFYCDDYSAIRFNEPEREERFYSDLERAKVPKEQLYAFQMVNAQELHSIVEPCNVEEYMIWLNLYDDIDDEEGGMFAAARRNKALALEKGMHFINDRNRLKYYIDLATLNERFPFEQAKELERCLNQFLLLNAHSNATSDIQALKDKVVAYLNGDISYEHIKDRFEKHISKDLDTQLNQTSTYSLGQFFWQLKEEQQKRLAILLINHSYRGYRVLEEDLFYAHLRQLVQQDELSMEEYLDLSPELHSEETDEYLDDAYDNLYDMLLELGDTIRQDYLVTFLLKTDTPCYKEHLVDRVRDNNLKAFIKNSSPSNRIELLQLLKEQPDAQDLIIPFINDPSRKVKSVAKSFLK